MNISQCVFQDYRIEDSVHGRTVSTSLHSWVTLTIRLILGFFKISSSSGVKPRVVLNFLADDVSGRLSLRLYGCCRDMAAWLCCWTGIREGGAFSWPCWRTGLTWVVL